MKDPVTISTGISYDRSSIERWLSTYDRKTCPVTKQPLGDRTLIPNTTLLRLIQSWPVAARKSSNLSTVMTPEPGSSISDVLREITDAMINPDFEIKALKKIRSLVQDDADNIARMEKAGVTSLVASIIAKYESPLETINFTEALSAVDEAMSVLRLLEPSPETLKQVSERKNGELITSLSLLLHRGSYRSRIHAALLLRSIFKVVDYGYKASLHPSLFEGVVEILKDHNSSRATTMALLSILIEVLPHGRNQVRVVEAGAVTVMVELLVEETEDRRKCETMLYLLEFVCKRAEGRAALVAHPAGVAAVVGKVLKVSSIATEKAVKVLGLVCRHCGVEEEMMDVGGVGKLFMVVQVEGSMKSKEMAKEILGMHSKEWSKFPCFSSCYLV
ncbi:E3 ubiquitin-protein ligase PUB23-like [Cocos nucifera]|uniref:U-box domain-containing protein n=1 Tax=Cocos nucifera TaxID=13894 RepID=A0A8K0N6X5_COCNU|nr:E3 ubiquitin-protein ligase PUB23-like [Cocos nucifera]